MKRTLIVLVAAWMGLGAAQPLSGQETTTESLTTVEVERVGRALEGRFACLGCHRIDGRGGLIGPMLNGLSDRADLAYTVGMIVTPQETVPGTIMPEQRLPPREAERLARYLLSLGPASISGSQAPAAPLVVAPGDSLNGAALYARHCAACHGTSGGGDGWNAANLPVTPTAHADPVLMSQRPDDTLYDGIAAGGWVLDKSPWMPAFGALLSPGQIRALVGHIRDLCQCEQPSWAARGR
ncbi:MAG: cytochrome c [Gemmatimonadota bacterium]|nr:cytochrome c [Gemmatimonadota bacterium]